jgi:gliding motility-associated-like protein
LKRAFLIPVFLYIICSSLYSQEIGGVVNYYLEVDSVFNDTVKVTGSMDDFNEGDYVILIQMTGATILEQTYFPRWIGELEDRRNCGKYEFLQIEKKITPENYIVFTSYLLHDYDNDEKIQLVKIMTGDELTVSSQVTSYPWDRHKGGIVALMAFDRLILNANISVSGQGFRGAVPEDNYTGGCRSGLEPNYDTCYFHYSQLNRAGDKGEGIVTTSFELLKGLGHALNGGGGGNGLYSGGAGGSSWGQGGRGGHQYEDINCGSGVVLEYAQGGFGANKFFNDNMIILGGGGGAGTENKIDSGRIGSSGGNGGGMVFILANTLTGIGSGRSIQASGQGLTGIVNASGGGGGGGGVILMDVTNNNGNISLYARGGNGGSTGSNCTGSGGGGGGGVVMHSGATFQANQIQTTFGNKGSVDFGCEIHAGNNGSPGTVIPGLILPLNGFLFNVLYGGDTICQGQVPATINASQPKGGDGSYSYQWIQSTDQSSWAPATGSSNLTSLSPVALDTTTYFRRIVSSTNPIDLSPVTDSGKIVKVLVYLTIKNNYIHVTDTICKNVVPQQLTGGILSGGGGSGSYSYLWQRSTDLISWDPVSYDSAFYESAPLAGTRYYRRIAASAQVCVDTSETDTITVLELITNNDFFRHDTAICYNDDAGKLVAKQPGNGDGTYSYEWQKSENSGEDWQPMAGTDPWIEPGQLTVSTLFRRIVYSGNDNACIDTSGSKKVNVVDSITSNNIFTDSSRYCAGDIPGIIHGRQPDGGTGTYSYKWLGKTASNWSVIAGETDSVYSPSDIFETTTSITRVVYSGQDDACIDTAASLVIDVVPYISNVLGLGDQSICENNTPAAFTADSAGGGAGGYIYQWLLQVEGSAAWNPAPIPNDNVSYSPGPLSVSTSYVRKVYSDICSDISDTIHVTVYELIRKSTIKGDTVRYACYNTSKLLEGSIPEGGNPGDYGYQWEYSDDLSGWTPASGVSPADQQSFRTSGLASTGYFRRIVYSSSAGRECSDTTGHVKVLINEIPVADIISAQDTICAGDSIYIRFNVSGGHSPWDVTVGTGAVSGTISGISSNYDSIPLTLYSSGNIKLISAEDDSSCFADTSQSYGIVNARVYPVPVAYAGGDTAEVCGREYVLNAAKSINNSRGLWETANATFDQPQNKNAKVTVNDYGIYTLIWTETYWQCFSSDTTQVIFYEAPASADAGEDQTLEFIFTAWLDALVPVVGYGTWSISSGSGTFDSDTAPNTVVQYLDYKNVLKWTVRNGVCKEVSDSINIIVNPLKVMKGFSPNGDGINDEFIIEVDNAEKVEILIFDRMGHIILQTDNYSEGNFWDGTNNNGNELPEGTYFYILKVKVEEKDEVMVKSYIELLR